MTTRRVYSLTIFAYRKEGMSEEDYHQYLTEKHSSLITSHFSKWGILNYMVTHIDVETREMMSQIFGAGFPDSRKVDYDSMSQIFFDDIEDYLRARNDPFYHEVIFPDHENFADTSKTRFVTGWVESFIQKDRAS